MPQPRQTESMWQYMLNTFIFRRLPGVLLGLLIGFGIVFTAQAQEPEACGFGLLQCDEQGVVWDVPASGANNLAQLGGGDGLIEFITAFGFFLNRQIIPLLFAFAFFFFIYYLARYFVLDRANEKNRDEAKQRALWGLGAFIFLVSIWGIVNLFVLGLGWDDSRVVCPDYLGDCGEIELEGGSDNPFRASGGSGGSFFSVFLGFESGRSTFEAFDSSGDGFVAFEQPATDTRTTGDTTVSAGTDAGSALAELLFGSSADDASFDVVTGSPQAAASVVAIAPQTSCVVGMQALQTSAAFESLQAAYAYRETSSGESGWTNVTDRTSTNFITFDADHLQLTATVGESRTALIHTHPRITPTRLRLDGGGYVPSVSDMLMMCDGVYDDAQYVVVDADNVWVTDSIGVTCPRRAVDRDNLPIISVLAQLSVLDPAERNDALATLAESATVPAQVRANLEPYRAVDLSRLSSAELMVAADNLAREGDMRIRRMTPADFCAQF
ncbi:MAG TPA: hypothetical protein VKP88_01470 [Candidatus Paceibacterota bacterium]|nr:hypothetical protein [Candidatus Paceibacterota bacterium]